MFPIYSICHLQIVIDFFLSNLDTFFLSFLISVAKIFDAMHHRSGKSGHPILFLILEERLSAFHC